MPQPRWRLNPSELARIRRLIKTDPETQCWEWQGMKTPNGYGKHRRGPGYSDRIVHRIVYEHYKDAKIPPLMQLDHLCRNRICCNPEHFEIVTASENTSTRTRTRGSLGQARGSAERATGNDRRGFQSQESRDRGIAKPPPVGELTGASALGMGTSLRPTQRTRSRSCRIVPHLGSGDPLPSLQQYRTHRRESCRKLTRWA